MMTKSQTNSEEIAPKKKKSTPPKVTVELGDAINTIADDVNFDDMNPDLEDLESEEVLEDDWVNPNVDTLRQELEAELNAPSFTSDPVRDYLRQIGQVSLLTYDQEKDLARRFEMALYAQKKLEEGKKISKLLRRDLEWIVGDGMRAKDHLVEANLRLVVSLAKRYSGHSMRFQDLIQEGNVGLIRAAEKYDYSKTFRFSTYATWWIRQSITRAMADRGRTIRIPVHMVEVINRVNKVQKRMAVDMGRKPTPEEIAEEMDIPLEKVLDVQKFGKEPASIYSTLGDEGDTEIGDLLEDTNEPDMIDIVSNKFMQDQLLKIIDNLNDKERAVIELRYGLYDQVNHTLDDIGRTIGVTRERVRQIEKKTIEKLAHPSRSQFLKDFYEK